MALRKSPRGNSVPRLRGKTKTSPRSLNVETLEDRNLLAWGPVGTEFLVNSAYTTSAQTNSVIAADGLGNFVVAWQGIGHAEDSYGIYAQRYNSSGAPQGGLLHVNSYSTSTQMSPALAVAADGSFVIAWESNGQDGSGYGIYARRYDTAGNSGSEFRVNVATIGAQRAPAVAIDSTGDFVIAWQGPDGNSDGIFARRYDASGTALGSELSVNSYSTSTQSASTVAMDSVGNFTIAWQSFGQDSSSNGIYAQRFNAAGTKVGGELQVHTTTTNAQQDPALGMDSSGGFVVAWTSSDLSNEGIFFQRFDAAGVAQGVETRANTWTTNAQLRPAISVNAAGSFVISWDSDSQDGSGYGVYLQRFDANGVAQGTELRANATTAGHQRYSSVAMTNAQVAWVVWSDSTSLDVYAHAFAENPANQVPTANAGGPYSIYEGASLVLNASASSDPDVGQAPYLTYAWDLNSDGIYGDVVGNATLSWATLSSWIGTGPQTRSIGVRVTDPFGLSANGTTSLSILENHPPIPNAGGPYLVIQGAAIQLNASASNDPDPGQTLTYTWDVNGDYVFGDAAGVAPTLTWSQLNALGITSPGDMREVRVGVSDSIGAVGVSLPASLTVIANTPPVANAGGPYTVVQGNAITFNGAASSDPDGQTLSYSWDLNGDGVFGEATGSTKSYNWNSLIGLGLSPNPGVYNIALRVTDASGASATAATTLTITPNTPPTAKAGGPYVVWADQSVTVTAAGSGDVEGSVTYSWDVNGDGVYGDATGFSFSLTPSLRASLGIGSDDTRSVRVQVTDSFGAVTISQPVTLVISSSLPVVRAGGPYVIYEGESLIIDGASTEDTDPVHAIYSVDVNGDGNFSDASRTYTPDMELSWSQLVTLGVGEGPNTFNLQMRYQTSSGQVVYSPAVTFTVLDSIPSASLGLPTLGEIEQNALATYILQANDPSISDQAGNYTFHIDWDGDGNTDETVVGPSGITVQHAFSTPGYVTIGLQATGTDGVSSLVKQTTILVGSSHYGPLGAEVRVNQHTTSSQGAASIALDSSGNYVVVWQSSSQDGSGTGIYGRRYAADGSPLANEFRVNSYTSSTQQSPAVAQSASGAFVVVWDGQGSGDTAGIWAQRYDSAGTAQGSAILVNTYTSSTQSQAAIAMNNDGSFVVTWQSNTQDGSSSGVYGQRFDATGTKLGAEFRVNVTTAGSQESPTIGKTADGGFVIAWATSSAIYFRRFDATGTALTGEIAAISASNLSLPSLAVNANGELVTAWQNTSDDDIYARKFDSSGNALTSAFRVNTFLADEQLRPVVGIDDSGSFIILWDSADQDNGTSTGIYGQRYLTDGTPLGTEFRLNSTTINNQYAPALAMDSTGRILSVWTTNGTHGSSDDVVMAMLGHYVNAAPVAYAGGPYLISEGNGLTLSASGTVDPDFGQALYYSWDINGDGTFGDAVGVAPILTWSQLTALGIQGGDVRNVAVRVNDNVGGTSDSVATTLTVEANLPPVADPGGPYQVIQGSALTLDGSGSTDPNPGQTGTLTYSWDVNGDGVFGDVTGIAPTLTWTQLLLRGIGFVPETRNLALRVQDINGVTNEVTTTLTVLAGTPPTATAGGPYSLLQGDSVTLVGVGIDPDPGQTSSLIYAWDLNGDNLFGDVIGNAPTVSWSTLLGLGIGTVAETRSIRLQATDRAGLSTISSPVTLTIVPNQAPIATAGGPYEVVEQGNLVLSAGGSIDPEGRPLTYSWDVNGDGVFGDASGSIVSLSWTQLLGLGLGALPDTRLIRVRVSDGFQTATSAAAALSILANRAPLADAGGPYTVSEGSGVTLDASASYDLDPAQTLSYSWDVNGDGVFGDATGRTATLTWAQLGALGINDGNATRDVAVRVTDSLGGITTSSSTSLAILNVAPQATVSGPAFVQLGSAGLFTLAASDPANADQGTFTYDIDWDGDGSLDETVVGVSGITVSHVFAGAGDYSVRITATDKDGGVSATAMMAIRIVGANSTSGPYIIQEGSSLSLAAFSDIDSVDSNTTFSWDLNGDGVYSDVTGRTATVSWSTLVSLGFSDGPSARNISVHVANALTSQTATLTSSLEIVNSAPTAVTVTGSSTVGYGQNISLTVSAIDPSAADQAANFTFLIDFNDDGIIDKTYSRASGSTISTSWVYGIGAQTIKVYARDKDGAVSTVYGTSTVNVTTTFTVTEGGTLYLDSSQLVTLSDPYSFAFPHWELNGDQLFDSDGSIYPVISWSTLEAIGVSDGPSARIGTFAYQVYDSTRPTSVPGISYRAFSYAILNAAPTAAAISGPANVTVGKERSYTLTATDPSSSDQLLGFTFDIDWNNDGTTDETVHGLSGMTVQHTFLTAGLHQVRVTATDKDGGSKISSILNVSAGTYPATAGGPYSINEDQSLQLFGQSPLDADDGSVTYEWDVNGDGIFGDATGNAPLLTWAQLQALGLGDGPATRMVTFRVTEVATSNVQIASTTLSIVNAGPTVSISGPSGTVVGRSLQLTLNATDPSAADQAAGFNFAIDWENDGIVDELVSGPSGITVTHTFTSTGTASLRVWATDKDGSVSNVAAKSISVLSNVLTVTEGQSASLNGSQFQSQLGSGFYRNIAWDLDGDGDFDDASGFSPSVSWANLLSLGLDEGPGTGTWALRFDYRYDTTTDFQTVLYEGILNILNGPPAPSVGGSAYAIANKSRAFTFFANDPSLIDQAASFTYDFDWNNDGIYDETVTGPSAVSVTHMFAGVGSNTIKIRATDKDGGVGTGTVAVQVLSGGTTAGGAYTISESATTLFVSGISDIDEGDGNTTYSWDLNGDGVFGDAVGNTAILSAAQLASLGLLDGPQSYTVTLQAINSLTSQTASATTTLSITSIAPTLSVSGPETGNVGEVLTYTFTATDPSPQDQAGQFTYHIDWDGNGTDDQTVTGGSVLTIGHTYGLPVSDSIRARVVDKNSSASSNIYYGIDIYGPSGEVLEEGENFFVYVGIYDDPFIGAQVPEWSIGGVSYGTSTSLSLSWAQLVALGLGDGPSSTISANYMVYQYAGLGNIYPRTYSIPITVANKAPTLLVSGNATTHVGLVERYTLTATDPSAADQAAGFTFDVDWDGDGTIDESFVGQSGMQVSHVFQTEGTSHVLVTARDKDGGISGVYQKDVTVGTVIDAAGSSYSIKEGDSLLLSATSSIDNDDGNTQYSWDVNGDGIFGDAVGRQAYLTWSQMQALGFLDQVSAHSLYVRITNTSLGYTNTASSSLMIQNAAPTATSAILPGTDVLLLGATDPSANDQASNFNFNIDWNNDGAVDEVIHGPAGTTVSHAFTGAATVRVVAVDKDGAVSTPQLVQRLAASQSMQPIGPQTHVNTTTSGNQSNAGIAHDADGNYVIVWEGDDAIYAQRYDSTGALRGPELRVTPIGSSDYVNPKVAMDANGNFVISYQSEAQVSYVSIGYDFRETADIYIRRYDSNGSALGNQSRVNTFIAGEQTNSNIAMDDSGNYVVVWYDAGRDSSQRGIYARRYSSNGSALGGEFLVNTATLNSVHQNPSIALNSSGDFLIVWDDNNDVFARQYSNAGASLTAPFQVNSYATGVQSKAQAAFDAAGGFLVVWSGEGQGDANGIFGRRFDSSGNAVGVDLLINSYTTGVQRDATVAMDANGDVLVSWSGAAADGESGISGRRILPSGGFSGSEFRIANDIWGIETLHRAIALGSGSFGVVWQNLEALSGSEIYFQRLEVSLAVNADAGTSYAVVEGGDLVLDGSASSSESGSLAYFWDVNGDGDFSDAFGVSPILSAAQLHALGLDGPNTYGVRVWVVSADSTSALSVPVVLTVTNATPTASVVLPAMGLRSGGQNGNAVRGQTREYIFSATDPSAVDETSDFTFTIDWGDGSPLQVVSGPNGMAVSHVYTATQLANPNASSGTYTITFTAADKDGAVSAAVQQVVKVVNWDRQTDVGDPSKTNLVWGGTAGIDAYGFLPGGIVFIQAQNNSFLGTPQIVMTGDYNGKLVVYAQGGNDLLFADVINGPLVFFGGDGDDVLVGGRGGDTIDGGNGNDIIFGGTLTSDGDDLLIGGAGDDLIIGHLGADTIYGGSGSDLLVAGSLYFPENLPASIYTIQSEWLASRPLSQRVANLSGTGASPRNNGQTFLQPGSTVIDDQSIDQVFGEADADWLILADDEDITSLDPEDLRTDLQGST